MRVKAMRRLTQSLSATSEMRFLPPSGQDRLPGDPRFAAAGRGTPKETGRPHGGRMPPPNGQAFAPDKAGYLPQADRVTAKFRCVVSDLTPLNQES